MIAWHILDLKLLKIFASPLVSNKE